MKKVLISSIIAASSLLAITAGANTSAMSNANPHHNMKMQHYSEGQMNRQQNMMENMASMLNLTDSQQAQIRAIRQNNRVSPMQNHQAMMEILTPEQRQKLSQMQPQRMNQGSRMMNKDGRMNQGGRMNMNQN